MKNRIVWIAVILAVPYISLASTDLDSFEGQSVDAIIEMFGQKPSARMKMGNQEILIFPSAEITAIDGVVTKAVKKATPSAPTATSKQPKSQTPPPTTINQPPATAPRPLHNNTTRIPVTHPDALYFGTIAIEFDNIDFNLKGAQVKTETVNNARVARKVFTDIRKEFRKYAHVPLQKEIDVIYFVKKLEINGESVDGAVDTAKRAICVTTPKALHQQLAFFIIRRYGNTPGISTWESMRKDQDLESLLPRLRAFPEQSKQLLLSDGLLNRSALESTENDIAAIWNHLMTQETELATLAKQYPPVFDRVQLLLQFLETWFSKYGSTISESSLDLSIFQNMGNSSE